MKPHRKATLFLLLLGVIFFPVAVTAQATGGSAAADSSANNATEAPAGKGAAGGRSADATQPSDTTAADGQGAEAVERKTEEKRKAVLQEAASAITETRNALQALDSSKPDEALAALERATGKLEILLAREPELRLAPVGLDVATYDVVADVDAVESLASRAARLVDEGRLQEARHLLQDLASETVLRVTAIPLATYPEAIKVAARLVDETKEEEAKLALQAALNTLVVQETIIPLPIVAAEELLQEAETLAEKSDRSPEDTKRLATLLRQTRSQLQFAEALGYRSSIGYQEFYKQLNEIEEKTQDGKSGTGFFNKIKRALGDLFDSSQPTT